MPVESSQDTPFVQYHPSHHHHRFLPCYADDLDLVSRPDDLCLTSSAQHISASAATAALTLESNDSLISTHSPPLINLSPNLSPSSESRFSPFYDFRETTRRRSAQGKFAFEMLVFKMYTSNDRHSGMYSCELNCPKHILRQTIWSRETRETKMDGPHR